MVGETPQLDVRAQILRQAARLFAARGFGATSLQQIADAVGVRKPSLLYHFASKDALRRRVLEQMLSRWNDVLPQVLLGATSSHEQFDGVLQGTVDFFRTDPDRARLLAREVLDRPSEMRELVRTHVAPWVEAIAAFIRKGQQQQRLWAEVDPEAYVIQMINLLVSSIAVLDSLGTIDAERNTSEIIRVAKSSLFRSEED